MDKTHTIKIISFFYGDCMDKIQKGYQLFQEGKVKPTLLFQDNMQFEVESSVPGKPYVVSILENEVRCTCDDYYFRNQEAYGSYICKHIWAALFKVTSLGLQSPEPFPAVVME